MMVAKRLLDLVIGLPATVILTPVMVVLAGVVVVTSGWPAVIKQRRVGADEAAIDVWKFRTMRVGTPIMAKSALVSSGLTKDMGLYTPLGPWMRRFSLDELPQVYSVLRGDMALVGPRPALQSQHDLLALRRKHWVTRLKPGLTGLAQIEGREALTLATKVRFEAHYLKHMSPGYDLGIIARTFRALLSRRGAF